MNSTVDGARVGDFQLVRGSGDLELYLLPTTRFKTRLLRIHFRAPMDQRCCVRSLLPNLLRRGTTRHPSMRDISRALEEQYGSVWASSTYKLGQEQVLCFRLEVAEERFLPGQPPVFSAARELAREFLREPRLEEGLFPEEEFEQERRNLRHEIEAQFNDKMTFAFHRLLEEMFPGDPYGLPVLGTLEDCEGITREQATEAWRELEGLPARVFLVGDCDVEEIRRWVEEALPFRSGPSNSSPRPWPEPAAPREITETQSVSQSKLLIGYPLDHSGLERREYDALRMYTSILGGGYHSRLFQSVREEHSLAYHASSSMDRIKGVMYLSFGIDSAHRSQVLEIVGEQLESLRRAPPDAEEFEQSRRLLVSGSRSLADSPGGMVDVLEGSLASGFVRSLEQSCQDMEQLNPEDVHQAAQRIGPPRIIYTLAGEARHDEG